MTFHLAQVNVTRLRAPLDTPLMADFAAGLEPMNDLAEATPGFVWRLQDEGGDATAIRAYDDDQIIVNLTLWTSVDALADYVYRSDHVAFLRRKREWFTPAPGPAMVLWWVPAGHRPDPAEAKERLAHLEADGPTLHAFTFRHRFDPPP